MNIYNCIIVDDDEMDRLLVVAYAKRFENLNIVGVFDTAKKALAFLTTNTVDVAFLDIELQNESGIELRKHAMQIPACVFISSHTELAVDTFMVNTLDFISKPYNFERFTKAVSRVDEFMEMRDKAAMFETNIGGDVVYLKVGTEQIKIKMQEILYLEALRNHTMVVTNGKRHCVLAYIGDLLSESIFGSFVRVHRSFAVQKNYIKKFTSSEVLMANNDKVPISRSYKDVLNFVL